MNPDNVERAAKYFKENKYDVYYPRLMKIFSYVVEKWLEENGPSDEISRCILEGFDLLAYFGRPTKGDPWISEGAANKIMDRCKDFLIKFEGNESLLGKNEIQGTLYFAICVSYHFEGMVYKCRDCINAGANNALKAVILFSRSIGWKRINEELTV